MPKHYTPGPLPFLPYTQFELICEQCAVRFLVPKKKAGTQRFCSISCRGLAQQVRVSRPCEQCGATVPPESQRRRRPSRGRYCSPACFNLGRVKSPAERFWPRVRKTDGCWLWTGQVDEDGYGRLRIGNPPRRRISAHRLSWTLEHGPIADDLVVCHRCDNPPCVRPSHLFLGSAAANRRDCVEKQRQSRGERHATAKLTPSEVLEIRALVDERVLTHAAIGARFGVGPGAVGAIGRRKTWKHLA